VIPYINYTYDADYIDIQCLGDIHWGHRENSLRGNFCRIVEDIDKDEHTRWLSHGDLLEHALKTSVSEGVKSEPVDVEFASMTKMLQPVREKGLAMVGGNHGLGRANRLSALDPDLMLATILGVPYLAGAGILQITFHNNSYVIHLWHGRSAAITTTGKMNSGNRMELVVCNADVHLFGHTHLAGELCPATFEVDRVHKRVRMLNKILVNAGHMMDYVSYAAIHGYRPHTAKLAKLRLYNTRKKRIDVMWSEGT